MTQYSLDISNKIQNPPDDIDRFGPLLTKATERPKRDHSLVKTYACQKILPNIINWMAPKDDLPEDEKKEILEDLLNVCNSYDDEYTMAKNLDNSHGWCVDSDLVYILKDMCHHLSEGYQKLLKIWVKTFSIIPSLSIHDSVEIMIFKKGIHSKTQGVITDIYHDKAQYLVYCPELGHVKNGPGTYGILINYEDIIKYISKS